MSATEDDILFRIGFESHPQAGAKLEALAQAVEMTQKRIDQMFTTTADRVAKAVTAMSGVTGKGPSGSDSGEAKMRAELKATADAFQQQSDRLIALQADMVTKLDQLRAKDVSSADGHAKRLEAIYANTLANLNAAVTGAKAGTNRVQVAVGGGDIGPPNMQTGASQLEAMATARRATQNRIIADTAQFNEQLELAAGHEILTLEQRNEGAQLFARARAAIMRGEAEMASRELAHERELNQQTIAQLREDIALIEDIQRGGDGGGATPQQAAEAAERVKAYYETIRKGQEEQAAGEAKLAEMQRREMAKQQAEQDRMNRNRKRMIEGVRRAEEQAARQAEAERRREESAADAAMRRRRALIERSKRYEQQLNREVAEEAIKAYEEQATAATRALAMQERGHGMLRTSAGQTATAIGKLSRSAVLLGLANGEEMEKVIRQLAMVQAGIDLVGGAAQAARGVGNAIDGVRMILVGKIQAQRAANAADALAVQGSAAVRTALETEALSAQRAAAAHTMLQRARTGGAAIQTPIVAQPGGSFTAGPQMAPGTAASGGLGRSVALTGSAILGGIGGGVAGAAVGEAGYGQQGKAIGSVMGTVAGGIIGPMLAAAIMRSNLAGRVGSGLSGGVGGILGRAGGMAGGAVMGGAGSVASGLGIGVGGGAAAVGGAALAALGGVALTLKSSVEMFRDASKNGFMGGSQAGSFNDRVGGSNWNPASWLMAADLKFQNMADEEKTRRIENAGILLRIEQGHLRNLQAIRIDSEKQREAVQQKTADANFSDRLALMRTPQEQLAATEGQQETLVTRQQIALRRLQAEEGMRDAVQSAGAISVARAPAGQRESVAAQALQANAEAQQRVNQALSEYEQASNRVVEGQQQQLRLNQQITQEERRSTMERLKGIEDVIRARVKESQEIEKQMTTARARFGQMTELQQELAKQSFERIKRVGAENADRRDIDRIRQIGTDETNRFVAQFDDAAGRRAGFDQTFGQDAARRQRVLDQEATAKAQQLGQETGQDPNKILENAKQPVQVELFDKKTFEIVLNRNDDVLFDAIVSKIEKIRAESDAQLNKRFDELDRQRTTAEAERLRLQQQAASI